MFVNCFKIYTDSKYIPPKVGGGFNTIMPWGVYAHIKANDLKAIYAYLQSLDLRKNEIAGFTPKE